MQKTLPASAACAWLFACLLTACGGGGGTALSSTFRLTGLAPDSSGLAGGLVVQIQGENFLDVTFSEVTFGTLPVASMRVLDDQTIEVVTPPAPGGLPQTVDVRVVTVDAGAKVLQDAFTYTAQGPPLAASINPVLFTPSGAEDFTITGTDLGLPGSSQVQVVFQGVGSVIGSVSFDGKTVTGRAPLSSGSPPPGSITVTVVRTAGQTADVPTQVTYGWGTPVWRPSPGQNAGGASQPVRYDDGHALLCIAGVDGLWRTADDDVILVQGPPNAPNVAQLLVPPGQSIGYLDPQNSIPAVLANGKVVLYSVGPDGLPVTADDRIVQITDPLAPLLQVLTYNFGYLNTVPLAAIPGSRFAFGTAGANTILGDADDMLTVVDLSAPAIPGRQAIVGALDTGGPTSISFPRSADGTTIVMGIAGANGIPRDADDQILFLTSPLLSVLSQPAPFLVGEILLLGNSAAAAVARPLPATSNDRLEVWSSNGVTLTRTSRQLGVPLNLGAPRPAVRLGASGVAVAAGVGLYLFTNAASGNATPVTLPGLPLLVGLSSLEALVYTPGSDLIPGLAPDLAQRIDAAAARTDFTTVIPWQQGGAPSGDAYRGFGIEAGPDGTYATGDERLAVQVTRAIGAARDGVLLPLGLGQPTPMTGTRPLVPVGPSWGVVQSSGPDGAFGTGDDIVVFVRF